MTRRELFAAPAGRAFAQLAAFSRDRRGAAAVEFAIIAPVMAVMLLGACEITHTLYMRTVLQGVVQKVSRDATLESGATTEHQNLLDDRVREQVREIANNSQIIISRRFYRTFAEAANARAEVWTDTNNSGTCDDGEPYEDANHNQVWDADGGNAGQGGAKDATLYTVRVSYPRFFPLGSFIDGSERTEVSAKTVLRNQPYSDQGSYAAKVIRNCPAAAAS